MKKKILVLFIIAAIFFVSVHVIISNVDKSEPTPFIIPGTAERLQKTVVDVIAKNENSFTPRYKAVTDNE